MRVLLAGPYPIPPRASTGGIESAVSLLSHGLSDLPGFDVHVATVAFDEPGGQYGLCDERVRLHVLHSRQATSQLRQYRLQRQWLSRVVDSIRPDIVHVHGTNFYGAAFADMRYPRVLTVHGLLRREARLDFSDSTFGWRLYRRIKGSFNARFERETLAHIRDIITISPYLEAQLAGQGRRFYSVANPVAERFFELDDKSEPGRVLFVGAIHARKGLIPLVRAVAELRGRVANLRLVIVGAVHSRDYERALQQETARLNLAPIVERRGHIPDSELDKEYAKAALVVLASQEESSPFAIQQAMAAAKPVVATRVGGIPAIVEEGRTGLLVGYHDVDRLAEALGTLLTNEEMRRRFGAYARERARERYSLKSIVAQTVPVLQSVVEESRRGRRG